MDTTRKDWWAPLYRGLVVDPSGKHIRQLDGAVWLLLYCFVHADRLTGELPRKYETIARDMTTPARTIRAWMRRLRKYDYVTTTGTGRAVRIRVLRWKPLPGRRDRARLSGRMLPARVAESGTGAKPPARESQEPRRESEHRATANKSLLTKDLLQQRNGGRRKRLAAKDRDEVSDEISREDALAADLAAGLDDPEGLSSYRVYAGQYQEPLLRRFMSEARAVPRDKIKRSRAALFRYLLNQHVNNTTVDPRG